MVLGLFIFIWVFFCHVLSVNMETELEKEEPTYCIFSLITDISFSKLDVDDPTSTEKLVLSVQRFPAEV